MRGLVKGSSIKYVTLRGNRDEALHGGWGSLDQCYVTIF